MNGLRGCEAMPCPLQPRAAVLAPRQCKPFRPDRRTIYTETSMTSASSDGTSVWNWRFPQTCRRSAITHPSTGHAGQPVPPGQASRRDHHLPGLEVTGLISWRLTGVRWQSQVPVKPYPTASSRRGSSLPPALQGQPPASHRSTGDGSMDAASARRHIPPPQRRMATSGGEAPVLWQVRKIAQR